MKCTFFASLVVCLSLCGLSGCGSNTQEVELTPRPPITQEELQTMESYEEEMAEANKAYQ
ncbi:hypothetical protein CA13_16200 [Planctomycetes bacterium CA13]|uniref:Secreted protein n=1 Tax=Novipirellula herctigrandis TaxID=2527986 RepID=A0A5C5Z051_9BACT|nr:hypothetical protein CA13_16200 [Planctomycetes bacterium CA13]